MCSPRVSLWGHGRHMGVARYGVQEGSGSNIQASCRERRHCPCPHVGGSSHSEGIHRYPWKQLFALRWSHLGSLAGGQGFSVGCYHRNDVGGFLLGGFCLLGGVAAESTASRKLDKYTDLSADYLFQPVALE